MKDRRKRTLLIILSAFVLSMGGVGSAFAQTEDDRPSEPRTLSGRIKWKKEMGLLPSAPDSRTTAGNICAQFYVVVTQLGKGQQVIASDSNLVAKTPISEPDYYYCGFEMTVPNNRSLVVTPRMGDVSAFFEPNSGRQAFHYTMPWIAAEGVQDRTRRRCVGRLLRSRKVHSIGTLS